MSHCAVGCWTDRGLTRDRPTGSNPSGCSSPESRKKEILALAEKYNLLVFEDDAYFFIHFDKSRRAPSYFELEASQGITRGRVVRFDSFSKIVSSGMRIGFITAHPDFLRVHELHTANTNLQPKCVTSALSHE